MLTDVLEHQILNLPPQDRSRILEKLIASLDEDEAIHEEWFAEAARRKAQVDAGIVKMLPGPETLDLLQAKYA